MRWARMMVAAASMLAVVGIAVAGGLKNTPHDFSTGTAAAWSGGEICKPCHTPHNAILDSPPLWNHALSTATFTYRNTNTVLGAQSLTCMGCHDGQTGVDSYGGVHGLQQIHGTANLGTDMTDDHPIGVKYGTSTRRASVTVSGTRRYIYMASYTRGLTLYGGAGEDRVECTTCHTPHDNSKGSFLNASNAGSAMCGACHTSQMGP